MYWMNPATITVKDTTETLYPACLKNDDRIPLAGAIMSDGETAIRANAVMTDHTCGNIRVYVMIDEPAPIDMATFTGIVGQHAFSALQKVLIYSRKGEKEACALAASRLIELVEEYPEFQRCC